MNEKHTPTPRYTYGLKQEIYDRVLKMTVAYGRPDEQGGRELVDRLTSHDALVAQNAELLAAVKQWASECGECEGTGINPCIVGIHTTAAGVGEEACPDCASIRAVIAKVSS